MGAGREYPGQPVVAVGGVVIHRNRVLLVQRANAPARGTWAIPGGRVRLGESLEDAVRREVFEECRVRVVPVEPVLVFDTIERTAQGTRFHYVIIDYVARFLSGRLRPGDDAAAAAWVSPAGLETLPVNDRTRRLLLSVFKFG
jgi:8-oxo-dGTP diphosphatase